MSLTSTKSRRRWEFIARGKRSAQSDAWLRTVAKRLIAEVFSADGLQANRRGDKALKIVGFSGRVESGLEQLVRKLPDKSTAEILECAEILGDIPKGDTVKQTTRRIENYRAKHKKERSD